MVEAICYCLGLTTTSDPCCDASSLSDALSSLWWLENASVGSRTGPVIFGRFEGDCIDL